MHAADVLALSEAVRAIERPSVGARIASVVGSPIERLIGMSRLSFSSSEPGGVWHRFVREVIGNRARGRRGRGGA